MTSNPTFRRPSLSSSGNLLRLLGILSPDAAASREYFMEYISFAV